MTCLRIPLGESAFEGAEPQGTAPGTIAHEHKGASKLYIDRLRVVKLRLRSFGVGSPSQVGATNHERQGAVQFYVWLCPNIGPREGVIVAIAASNRHKPLFTNKMTSYSCK
jgi:hypothetical protein